ncbi:MAG: hypothetical protein KUG69_04855 [Marinosulfonomonas sp.]|nr:hypothetical protein [Marinosulfonomonas sp.]
MSASQQTMRYDDIRKHVRDDFINSLSKFKERVSVDGPMEGSRLDSLKASRELADEPLDDYLDITTPDGGDALLRDFCERRGITDDLSPDARMLVQQELHKGYKSFLDEAIKFNASFKGIDLKPGALVRPACPSSEFLVPEAA